MSEAASPDLTHNTVLAAGQPAIWTWAGEAGRPTQILTVTMAAFEVAQRPTSPDPRISSREASYTAVRLASCGRNSVADAAEQAAASLNPCPKDSRIGTHLPDAASRSLGD